MQIDHYRNISPSAVIHETASIWHFAQVREHASIGARVVIGRGVYVGIGVSVGENSKIQNNAQIYEPAELGRGVFVGPGVILTNDRFPRAVTSLMEQKTIGDWVPVGVKILDGASIGAGAICVAPLLIGRWAMVAAGSVVVNDVPDHALVVGNPARQIGWVGHAGTRLTADPHAADVFRCLTTGNMYKRTASGLMLAEGLGA